MGVVALIEDLQAGSLRRSLGRETFDGYEQRLIRWGCSRCRYFEKRVFSTGSRSEELDAYMICRFAKEPMDLIGEATACPKKCGPESCQRKNNARRARGHKGSSTLKITVAA